MKIRKLRLTAAILAFSLLTMAASCDKYQKCGELAKDVASGVLLAQQVEIQLFEAGKVEQQSHLTIQGKFVQLADAGTALDRAINQAHSAKDASGALQAALQAVSDIQASGATGIKSQDAQIALNEALLAIKTTLSNIQAIGGR